MLAGVRHGATLGGPIAIEIGNTEWPKWETVMAPDPVDPAELDARPQRTADPSPPWPRRLRGHAQVRLRRRPPGARARQRPRDRRTVAAGHRGPGSFLRAGARRRGGLARHLHRCLQALRRPAAAVRRIWRPSTTSPVRPSTRTPRQLMIAEIEAAKKDGDTLGGVVEVVVDGLPIGLGSFTSGDNRLDSQLAAAVMGIQAIKGVEIGDGFETARRRGSVAHDEMYPGPDGVMRSTNRAGGLEGGMTNGQPLRGARRDEADLHRPARWPPSTWPPGTRPSRSTSGPTLCAVPAAGVVGGDHGRAGPGPRRAGEVRRRLAGRDPRQRRRLPALRRRARAGRAVGSGLWADGPQGGTGRACRVRQVRPSAAGWPRR